MSWYLTLVFFVLILVNELMIHNPYIDAFDANMRQIHGDADVAVRRIHGDADVAVRQIHGDADVAVKQIPGDSDVTVKQMVLVLTSS